jgi:hypothetical protein
MSNKYNYRKAQVSLELSISIFIALFLLVAAARVLVWATKRMVQRQSDYESTRVAAGSVAPDATICTQCYSGINWIGVKMWECDLHSGDWRYFCVDRIIFCVNCDYADSWSMTPDPICQSSARPPERRCMQDTPALEIQVNETAYPRLDIFENYRR